MYIYIIGNDMRLFTKKHNEIRFIKVGISKDPEKRLTQLQTGCPFTLKIIKIFKTEDALKLEALLHKDLERYNTSGEWFMVPVSGLSSTINTISNTIKNGKLTRAPRLTLQEQHDRLELILTQDTFSQEDLKKFKGRVSQEFKYRLKCRKAVLNGLLTKASFHTFTRSAYKKLDLSTRNTLAYKELLKEVPYYYKGKGRAYF